MKNFKRLEHERPKDAKAKSVMNLEVTVDTEEQPLGPILKTFGGRSFKAPIMLSHKGEVVFEALMAALEKNFYVREGILRDIVQSFTSVGIRGLDVLDGINELMSRGYLRLQHDDGTITSLQDPTAGKAWVRYQQPLLDCIISGGDKAPGEIGRSQQEFQDRVDTGRLDIGEGTDEDTSLK